ncbi:MAG: hypothetical protein LBU32_18535 [Clostridiales bacterium]|nr:hypothetical protein [Clostridiales bacterium]
MQMYKAAGPLKTAVFDTAKDLFPEKANFNERYKTDSFRESAAGFAANTTYSQTMDYINRHVDEAEKFSSTHYFHSLLQNEGDSLAEAMDGLAGKALDESVFDSETLQPEGPPQLAPASAADPRNVFAEAAKLGLKIDKINLMDCENPDEAIYASVGEVLAEAQIRKPGDKAEKLENVAPEAENAEEPAFGKCQSAESAESAESDGSSTEPNAEIGKNSDESLISCGGAGQEAAERPLKAFYSAELDSRSRKDIHAAGK